MSFPTLEDKLFRWVLTPLIVLLVRTLVLCTRYRTTGLEHYHQVIESGRPVIFVFWHEDLISSAIGHLKMQPTKVAVMVSRSRDGERLSGIIRHLHMTPVRASSSKGAVRGALELHRWLTRDPSRLAIAAIALDGPRGPRRKGKPGVLRLASMSDALILPTGFDYSKAFTFGSWDRTRLLKPFSKLTINFGQPIDPRQWQDDAQEFARHVTRTLNELRTEDVQD